MTVRELKEALNALPPSEDDRIILVAGTLRGPSATYAGTVTIHPARCYKPETSHFMLVVD